MVCVEENELSRGGGGGGGGNRRPIAILIDRSSRYQEGLLGPLGAAGLLWVSAGPAGGWEAHATATPAVAGLIGPRGAGWGWTASAFKSATRRAGERRGCKTKQRRSNQRASIFSRWVRQSKSGQGCAPAGPTHRLRQRCRGDAAGQVAGQTEEKNCRKGGCEKSRGRSGKRDFHSPGIGTQRRAGA